MSLYRYLPTPSHRMSLMWTLMTVDEAIVLEYGPAGTTHYSIGLFNSMGLKNENKLFTTHISEDDVIMGDVSRLEKAILELDSQFSPKVIFVIESGVTAVIGTDIQGVCHYLQDKVSARLLPMSEGGLRGDYTTGLQEAYTMLVKEIPKDGVEKQPLTCNILGASVGSYRIRSDIWEIKDLLARAFDLQVNVVLGLETSLTELEEMGGAILNIALRNEAIPAANILKERFDTPFVSGAPYGYSGTLHWLLEIGKVLDKEVKADVQATLKRKDLEARQVGPVGMPAMMMGKQNHQATLVGEAELLKGLSQFLQELSIQPAHKICTHMLKENKENADGIVYHEKESERLEILKNIHGHLLLGDDISAHVSPDDNMAICVSFPCLRQEQVATHLPVMGERGADWLVEQVLRFLAR